MSGGTPAREGRAVNPRVARWPRHPAREGRGEPSARGAVWLYFIIYVFFLVLPTLLTIVLELVPARSLDLLSL